MSQPEILPQSSGRDYGYFQELNEKGHTIVMITHEPDIAEYAQRIILLKDGRIVSDKSNGLIRKGKKKNGVS